MPKKVAPLSNLQVQNAKPRDKQYDLSDGQGLSLRVRPNGSRNWVFKYQKPYSSVRTNMGFGNYPEVSLQKARERRSEALQLLADNIDPISHKNEHRRTQEQAQRHTLRHAADEWIIIKRATVSQGHADRVYASLQRHVFPRLGAMPIHEIKAHHVIEDVLQPLQQRGKGETRKRTAQQLNEIMVYAVNVGLLAHNPLSGVSKAFASPEKRPMPALPPSDLPQLLDSISYASIKPVTRFLILFQLHTMVRPSEAAGAMWEEVDEKQALWIIPAERMKKKKVHKVPLSTVVLKLLPYIKMFSCGSPYLFPADRNNKKPSNSQTANKAIERMGYKDRQTAHGLRSLASTTLNEQGFDPDVIEAALAHVDKNSVRAAYNRAEYIERRRDMMEWWSNYINQCGLSLVVSTAQDKNNEQTVDRGQNQSVRRSSEEIEQSSS